MAPVRQVEYMAEVQSGLVDFAIHGSRSVYRLRTLRPGLEGNERLQEAWKTDLVQALGLHEWTMMDFTSIPTFSSRAVPLVGVAVFSYLPVMVSSYPPASREEPETEVPLACNTLIRIVSA